ncbi:putative lactoylglutathione lyase [Roseimicrobium gellanilyticum]|uniref:Putative lactoylglutathione lyase n=1 Tax=Roseimicrobium gellanilyticum TaxID=748857 RepID=A0A366HTM0_9BACT|nr:VOC family protein [Roseimicrobium gellanilyticum]RBP46273.1 putative lactoylglutathione lyase [Roseimicrobium gellanilyticum]
MPRRFDHIDLRVRNLEEVRAFYDTFLPALGFAHDAQIEGWIQYDAIGEDGTLRDFFGVTESPGHVANENRIAFWADTDAEVDRLAAVAVSVGARNVEGPGFEVPGYYAVFFEDASGNRFEICHRTN